MIYTPLKSIITQIHFWKPISGFQNLTFIFQKLINIILLASVNINWNIWQTEHAHMTPDICLPGNITQEYQRSHKRKLPKNIAQEYQKSHKRKLPKNMHKNIEVTQKKISQQNMGGFKKEEEKTT